MFQMNVPEHPWHIQHTPPTPPPPVVLSNNPTLSTTTEYMSMRNGHITVIDCHAVALTVASRVPGLHASSSRSWHANQSCQAIAPPRKHPEEATRSSGQPLMEPLPRFPSLLPRRAMWAHNSFNRVPLTLVRTPGLL